MFGTSSEGCEREERFRRIGCKFTYPSLSRIEQVSDSCCCRLVQVLVAMKQTLYASTLAQLQIDEPDNLFMTAVQEREDRMKQLIAAAAGNAKL